MNGLKIIAGKRLLRIHNIATSGVASPLGALHMNASQDRANFRYKFSRPSMKHFNIALCFR